MANTFKNSVTGSIGPSQTVATVIGVNVANVISQNISVSVLIVDTSTAQTRYLVKDTLIVPGSSTILVGGDQKLVLETGDLLRVVSSAAASADVVVSVLEIS
jgi:hypothetical protein